MIRVEGLQALPEVLRQSGYHEAWATELSTPLALLHRRHYTTLEYVAGHTYQGESIQAWLENR